jgi:hypothetical protein
MMILMLKETTLIYDWGYLSMVVTFIGNPGWQAGPALFFVLHFLTYTYRDK